VDDIVDSLAQRTAGRDNVECPEETGILTFRKLV
jgi:hypothetical protein